VSEIAGAESGRQYNPRSAGPRKPKKAQAGDGDAGGGGGSGGGGRRRREGGELEGSREGGGGNAALPPAIEALLFANDFFQKAAKSGKTLDTSDMDEADAFLADMFMESQKTESGEYRVVHENAGVGRVEIPRARPMEQLVTSMTPNIYAAPVGSTGYALGAQAWDTISKNYYWSESDRDYMANGIAREAEKILTLSLQRAKERGREMDLLFTPGFRKGLEYLEEEKRQKALLGQKPATVDYSQAETDWSKTAVIDEDQL
jgi:hypothetical protein